MVLRPTPSPERIRISLRPKPRTRGRHRAGVWLQSGPASFDSDKLGGFDGARLVESGVRWQHTLYRAGWFAVATIPDLVTVTSLTRISNQPRIWFYRNARHSDSVLVRVRSRDGHSVGVGTLPLAIRAAVDERKPLGAFVDLSAGLAFFLAPCSRGWGGTTQRPIDGRRRFPGAIGRRLEAELAYRLVHISNANTADENPGLNFHQIALAVGFRPRER